jgi:hypothetical protein
VDIGDVKKSVGDQPLANSILSGLTVNVIVLTDALGEALGDTPVGPWADAVNRVG